MRVKKVEGAEGIWEMTFSQSDPDGRATWEWTTIDGQPAIRWRRVVAHDILGNPKVNGRMLAHEAGRAR
jgi:hypothetical protein